MKVPAFITKFGAKLSENAPDICVVVGTGLMIGGGVWGCVQTAKHVGAILDNHNEMIEEINNSNISDEEKKKETREVFFETGCEFAKTFVGPVSAILVGATINGIGFGKMKKRYITTAVALKGMTKAYDIAMDRVRERWGEEGYRYVKYGQEVDEIEENGEKKKIFRGSEDSIKLASPYAQVITDGMIYRECGGSAIHIRSALESYQQLLNTEYYAGKPVYYNDVIRWIFGSDAASRLSDDGQRVGWYRRDGLNREAGDDHINLNISTFYGKIGDDDPYDQDKLYIMIDPNVPGEVSLSRGMDEKIRTKGKYLSQI